jgi:hypothetical protein
MYSLGVTLFCALTGHAAFERRTGEQVVTQFLRITSQPIPDLRKQELAADRDHRTGLGKHRHRGTVTVVTTKGQWEYFEDDCVIRPGVYVREKPDTIHTLHVVRVLRGPKAIEFVDALPRTSTGTVQKSELREKEWAGTRAGSRADRKARHARRRDLHRGCAQLRTDRQVDGHRLLRPARRS